MKFNIRVYGIIINDECAILLADEERNGYQFTKFPGGGLEFGEGIIECLIRECKEELKQDVVWWEHFYTTDFHQLSTFNKEEQLICIYYKIKLRNIKNLDIATRKFDFKEISEEMISLRWLPLNRITEKDVTFPIDKKVVELLKNEK